MIASLLNLEAVTEKFSQVIATTHLDSIALAIAHALEDVLAIKPMIEVMKTPSGAILFREDCTYYAIGERNEIIDFDPFTADVAPAGDVYSEGKREMVIARKKLERCWPALEFDYTSNTVLHQIVADLLTYSMNADQEWTKLYHQDNYDFLQEFVCLEKLTQKKLSQKAYQDFSLMMQDIGSERAEFMQKVIVKRNVSVPEARDIYLASDMSYENKLKREFWERSDVQEVMAQVVNTLEKLVIGLFPAVRSSTERSLNPAYGYDVYVASLEKGNLLMVKCLGDYRVLHWELNR